MSASCETSSVSGSVAQDLHVTVHLAGGDGQNQATVDASPALTEVYFELRITPIPNPFTFEVSQGTLAASRAPTGGFAGGTGGGLIVQAVSTGNGTWEARLQPQSGYSQGSATYQISVIVETKTASGMKDEPASFKAWLGTSMPPLTNYGVSYEPLWGGVLSALSSQSLTCMNGYPPPANPPP
eukprot:6474997-Prymnesium_polylepis.1